MDITSAAEFAVALDYLPVAVRASERNPASDLLWAEAVRAQRAVLDYADAHLSEAAAASVQAEVGTVCAYATIRSQRRYANAPAAFVAAFSQAAKARILDTVNGAR